jgi:hypothetical protein
MTLIYKEEKFLLSEIRLGKCLKDKEKESSILRKLSVAVIFVALLCYANLSFADEIIECPHCTQQICIDTPIAREVKGAGCYCDGCGYFYVHGQNCPKCGHQRKKLKWNESDGW